MRRTLGQIRAILAEGAAPAASMVSRRVVAGVYLGRLGVRIIKQWARDRCPQQAAALAYQTALSIVPVLAIAFTAVRSAGLLDARGALVGFIAERMFPDLPDVGRHLQEFSDKISAGAATSGLVLTMVACYSLYGSVGKIFNDIWRVSIRRPLLYRLLVFYALVTLIPVLASFYLYWSGRLASSHAAVKFLGPFVIQFAALLLTNKLLPNTFVRWRSAFVGTLASGLLLEGLKWGFVTFAKRMFLANYTGIYGPVGLVPVVLIWIWVSWLIVLLGAEIAHTMQNLGRLEAEDRRSRGEEPLNGVVATQLFAAVAADFQRGGQGVTRESLAHQLGVSTELVERICERLKASHLIAEVQGEKHGFIPSRPADTITLAEVLAAFRSTDLQAADAPLSPTLAALVRDLEDSRTNRIAGLTVADMLPKGDLASGATPIAGPAAALPRRIPGERPPIADDREG